MYIACPECNTKFVVKKEQISQNGRKVKCSRCTHIWHQLPIEDIDDELELLTPETSVVTRTGGGINLPALRAVKIHAYLFVMPIIMTSLIVFMLTMLFPNKLWFESLLNTNELKIDDIKIDHLKNDNKILVRYKIHNRSLGVQQIPGIRVRLLDKNHRVVSHKTDYYINQKIESNQYVQIETKLSAPPSSETVDIMLGNKIDFILR